jgi:WD40 repeat protein
MQCNSVMRYHRACLKIGILLLIVAIIIVYICGLDTNATPVCAVAFSPNGEVVAYATSDKKIRVRKALSGELVQVLELRNRAKAIAFRPMDSCTLASGGMGRSIDIWDLTTGTIKYSIEDVTLVNALAYSADGKYLASGSLGARVAKQENKTLCLIEYCKARVLLDGENGQKRRNIHAVAFAPDSESVAAGCGDGIIRVFDVLTGREKAVLAGHNGPIRSLAFSNDGNAIASGGRGRTGGIRSTRAQSSGPAERGQTLIIWDARTGEISKRLHGDAFETVCVAFSPNSKVLAAAGRNIYVFDVNSGEEVRTIDSNEVCRGRVQGISFSPDGKFIAVGSTGGIVCVWEVTTGGLVWRAD